MPAEIAASYIAAVMATLTAGAAGYCAKKARDIARAVEKADRRSQVNRQILTGEAEHLDGVLPRLDELEDEVGERVTDGGRPADEEGDAS